jgi:type IV pilus assembly protein PilA
MKKISLKNLKKKKKGFTLVELIIVIAIIAILAAMAIPKFSAMRADARVSNDVAKAKNLHTIAATLVANGTWKANNSYQSTLKVVTDRLDGPNAGIAEAISGSTPFTIAVGPNEDIKVSVGSNELYPDALGTGKAAYASTATGGKSTGGATGGAATGTDTGTGDAKTE